MNKIEERRSSSNIKNETEWIAKLDRLCVRLTFFHNPLTGLDWSREEEQDAAAVTAFIGKDLCIHGYTQDMQL